MKEKKEEGREREMEREFGGIFLRFSTYLFEEYLGQSGMGPELQNKGGIVLMVFIFDK